MGRQVVRGTLCNDLESDHPEDSSSTVQELMSLRMERCRVWSGMVDKSGMAGGHSLREESHLFPG